MYEEFWKWATTTESAALMIGIIVGTFTSIFLVAFSNIGDKNPIKFYHSEYTKGMKKDFFKRF